MQRDKRLLLIFIITTTFQFAIALYLIIDSELVLSNGQEIKLRLKPVDPIDIFRGHYFQLNIESAVKIENIDNWKVGDKCFAIFDEDSLGFYKLKSISELEPSKNKVYLSSKIMWIIQSDSMATLQLPINKFYIEESKAKQLESEISGIPSDSLKAYIITNYNNGKITVKDLIINKL
ncbi:MAG TPA: GDYXXLXY domain-containing protein [Candidatus Kapabacteria bacterium]|nr:GDYXXLXY domain-containing protein [Candidatus Kapabacteria bacterium]